MLIGCLYVFFGEISVSFASFLNWVIWVFCLLFDLFLLLSYRNFVDNLDINPSSDKIQGLQIFSLLHRLPFHIFDCSHLTLTPASLLPLDVPLPNSYRTLWITPTQHLPYYIGILCHYMSICLSPIPQDLCWKKGFCLNYHFCIANH